MRPFSDHIVGLAAEVASGIFSKSELSRLFVTVGLSRFVPKSSYAKGDLVSDTVLAALAAARKGNTDAADGITRFATRVVRQAADRGDAETEDSNFWQMREALRADGYDVQIETESVEEGWFHKPPRVTGVRILPLTDDAAPITDAITALEADLRRYGQDVAANCYRQAVDALVDGHFESANGQIRALYEEVVAQAAVGVGFTRTRQGVGRNAIDYLIKHGHLSEAEGNYIQGLWGMTHTNGPHPGATTAGEARFRMEAVTTAARYLVDRFFADPNS